MVVGTLSLIGSNTVDAVVDSMVVGTLSFVQIGQTTRMQWMQYALDIVVYGGGDIVLWCKKVKPVDAVCSGHSGIVIYGGGDIVFGAKRSNQWTQCAVDAVE